MKTEIINALMIFYFILLIETTLVILSDNTDNENLVSL